MKLNKIILWRFLNAKSDVESLLIFLMVKGIFQRYDSSAERIFDLNSRYFGFASDSLRLFSSVFRSLIELIFTNIEQIRSIILHAIAWHFLLGGVTSCGSRSVDPALSFRTP